ncbi:MAG TPA: stage III sporulation protein AD [bacterium]|jgi:stage III sporulation protein AD|nr:stage III sporulation protein AD [bacterium]
MEIIPITGVAIVCTLLVLIVRPEQPELALLFSLAVGTLIFLFAVTRLGSVVTALESLAHRTNINPQYFALVLKIIAIAYIAEFGAQICRDAGQDALAGSIELAGRVVILLLAVPILLTVFDLTLNLLP